MGIFVGERRASGMTFPEPVIPPFPGANIYGQVSVSTQPDTALQVPTVWACVSLVANAVSMLRLETFRRTADIPRRVTDPKIVTEPAAGMTQSEWLHMLMVSLLLRGNAFGRVVAKDPQLRPTQIELLNPDQVTVNVDDATGQATYKIGRDQRPVAPGDIFHVRGLTLPGSKVGLSPITYAAMLLGVDLSSRQFASDFFAGGGIPKAVVSTDQSVNQEQAQTIKERVLAAARQRQPIVLGAGLKYDMIQVKPEEAQFLATQQANVGQVARYFGVPAGMVGGNEGGSLTYSNVEQRSLDFLTYGVQPWLTRIEDAFFNMLPQPQYVKFNTALLLRTDAETQAKVDVQLLAGKIKAPSEIRAERDLPPMTPEQKAEADMVPLTVTPMGGAKALEGIKEPPGPVAPVPAGENPQEGAL